jgi:hypothetical protein
MTQYEEKVNLQGLKNDAEEWGKKVKYIHYNNGVEEVKYNNGKSVQTTIATGHYIETGSVKPESLIDKFQRAMVDMRK